MDYNIKLTDEFLGEIDDICDYISKTLKASNSAKKLIEKIIYNLTLLAKFPKMFIKIKKMSKAKRRYRRIVVKNYIILYTIDDNKKTIYIAHIYYGKRNYLDSLL